jgi:hypothetical protein
MNRASINRTTTGAANGSPALEIIAGANSKGAWLRSIVINLVAATASIYSVGRPAAKGITPTTPVPLNLEQDVLTGSGVTTTALAWGTPPTAPTQFFQTASLPATVGAQYTFTFQGIWIPVGSTVVLWNGAANSVVNATVIVDEVPVAN